MKLKNLFGHLHTINSHKLLVTKFCFKMGLYKQGMLHDLSKYSPTEFWPSVKYFQGTKSPISAERKAKGYSECWLHHKGHNKHHWEYWVDYSPLEKRYISLDIPVNYVKEMVCDRIAACMVYQKEKYHPSSALEYLENSEEKNMLHPNTYHRLKHYLTIVAENDLDKAISIIKNEK